MKVKDIVDLKGCYSAHDVGEKEININLFIDPDSLKERIAQLTAHRACCGSEHNPAEGKLHGYCVVCGVPWPCSYAGKPPINP